MSSGSSSWCMWSCAPAPRRGSTGADAEYPRSATAARIDVGRDPVGVVVDRGGLGGEVHRAVVDARRTPAIAFSTRAAQDAHDIPRDRRGRPGRSGAVEASVGAHRDAS